MNGRQKTVFGIISGLSCWTISSKALIVLTEELQSCGLNLHGPSVSLTAASSALQKLQDESSVILLWVHFYIHVRWRDFSSLLKVTKHQCARQTLCMIKRGWALNPSPIFIPLTWPLSTKRHKSISHNSYIWLPFTKRGRKKKIYTHIDIHFKYKILKLNT